MTVARGHDPRRFALVAIGGAGPMHACALADELGIPRVVDPALPGRRRRARPARHRHPPRPAPQLAAAGWPPSHPRSSTPSSRGWRPRPAAAAGAPRRGHHRSFEFDHELDMRYRGQAYNLTVPFAPRPVTAETIAAADAPRSRPSTGALYDYTPTVTETEIVTLRLARAGHGSRHRLDGRRGRPARRRRRRRARVYARRRRALDAPSAATRSRRTLRSRRRRSSSRRTPPSSSRPAGAARRRRRHAGAGARGGVMSTTRSTRSRRRSWPAVPPHRRGDGGGRVPLVVLADHPRDARLQLRPLHRRRAAWSRTPSRSRPSSG